MKITAILEISEDFRLRYEIDNCNAQDVLQEFVNQVSLPRHGTGEGNRYECATGFFMDYADQLLPEKEQPGNIYNYCLDKIVETVESIRGLRRMFTHYFLLSNSLLGRFHHLHCICLSTL